MSTIKDRNSINLTEAEDIKKRWQEYTEELYKKQQQQQQHFTTQIIMMIPHVEPEFLEWEVKWALGSITTNKANEGDGIPAELFHPKR